MNCAWPINMIDSCHVCDVSSEQAIKKTLGFCSVMLRYANLITVYCQQLIRSVPHGRNMHHPVALYAILTAINQKKLKSPRTCSLYGQLCMD